MQRNPFWKRGFSALFPKTLKTEIPRIGTSCPIRGIFCFANLEGQNLADFQARVRLPLLDLLLHVSEQGRVEEVLDGDAEAVTKLLDGGDGGAVVSTADNIVNRGLGDSAEGA